MESNDDSEFLQGRRDKQFANCKSLLEFNVARIRDNLRVKKSVGVRMERYRYSN